MKINVHLKTKPMNNNLGYACINTVLKEQDVKVNRTMVKKTYEKVGLAGVSEKALRNIDDLLKILVWNSRNGIKLYRMSSSMMPWMSEYEFEDLPDFDEIKSLLKVAGDIAKEEGMRLTFHPGHFTILASPKPEVVKLAIKELEQHARFMDLMGLSQTHYNKINIHIGGAYGDKIKAMDRFVENFDKLSDSVRSRLTIENDDRKSMYDVKDLMYVHEKTGIPIVFDFHHHDCHPGSLSREDALKMALSTWPDGIKPVTHFSSSKKIWEDCVAKETAHADYLHEEIQTFDLDFDIVVEAKAKEQAVLKYLKEFV